MTRQLDRAMGWVSRFLTFGPKNRVATVPPVPRRPGDAAPTRPSWPAYAVALLAPAAFGALLIPLRETLSQSIGLLMVLPVLFIALLGGVRLGSVAAISSAVVFGVVHTEPYGRFKIDNGDDVIEVAVLLVVGVLVGILADSAERSVLNAKVRGRELDALAEFIGYVSHVGLDGPDDALVTKGAEAVQSLLSARSYEWRPGYRGTAAAVLRPDGTISQDELDTAVLPPVLEVPVGSPPLERGRLLMHCSTEVEVSLEERRAAATLAIVMGRLLDGRSA
jgi:K+-sensing histidine kinase KdpD